MRTSTASTAARLVIGPHGGAFGNLVFTQPGTAVVEFVPRRSQLLRNQHSLAMYWGLAQAAGLDYWRVEPEAFEFRQPGMRVDIDEVAAVVRRILE